MNAEKLEVVRGSGNVFRDLGRENADLEQLKALLAAGIIKALDRDGLTILEAQAQTGFAATEISGIRNANLGTITLDRLVSILDCLGGGSENGPVPAQS
jgi:Helix-turn-helix domain